MSTLAPSRRRLYWFFLTGGLFTFGNTVTLLALPWFVLATTGSGIKTGVTVFAGALATLISSVAGGAVVDRIGPRRTVILADLASGLSVGAIALLEATGNLNFLILQVLVFTGALLDVPGRSARRAWIPQLAQMAQMPLVRANAIQTGTESFSDLLGAPLTGVLIVLLGHTHILWVNAATFAISSLVVALACGRSRMIGSSTGSLLREMADGFRWLKQDRLVLVCVGQIALSTLLTVPMWYVVMPFYVHETFGTPVVLGILGAANGGGMLVGTLMVGWLGTKLPRRFAILWSPVLVGLPFWAMSLSPSLPLLVVAVAAGAMLVAPHAIVLETLLQERVPAHMLGRVFSLVFGACILLNPVGMLAAGVLVDSWGVALTVAAVAVGRTVLLMGFVFVPILRRGVPPPTPVPAASPAGLQ